MLVASIDVAAGVVCPTGGLNERGNGPGRAEDLDAVGGRDHAKASQLLGGQGATQPGSASARPKSS